MPQTTKSKKTNITPKKKSVIKSSKLKNKKIKIKTSTKKTSTNKIATPKVKNLHVATWALTTGIIVGGYLFFAVIMELFSIETFLFSEKYYKLLVSIYPGIITCLEGAFIAFFYGFFTGVIFGGLFASLHNYIRRFFK